MEGDFYSGQRDHWSYPVCNVAPYDGWYLQLGNKTERNLNDISYFSLQASENIFSIWPSLLIDIFTL